MTLRNRRHLRITLLGLCCLLLAQWSLVTHACPLIWRAGERITQQQVEATLIAELAAAAVPDCHGAEPAVDVTTAPDDSPTCLKHCTDEGSANVNGGPGNAEAGAAPPLVLRAARPPAINPVQWQRAPTHGAASDPPLTILYCVYLI